MAAGKLYRPGNRNGPCVLSCTHRVCVDTRRMAASVCRLCERPIGYGVKFYADDEGLVHASCFAKALDEAMTDRSADEPVFAG